jgi:hypothetical protein
MSPEQVFDLSDWHRWWKRQGGSELRDLLMLWWDPIGVYGIPEAIDEYDGYVGRIGRLLREGATSTQIAGHFAELQPGFGLSANASRDGLAAEKIMEWFTQSMQRLGEIETSRGTTLKSGPVKVNDNGDVDQ